MSLLFVLVPLIAFLYASVGFGGATGYLAAMSFFGIPPQVMVSTALLLNILVAGISFASFYRAGHLRRALLFPFILASVPAAFIGGSFKLSDQAYSIILYTVLTFVAIRLLFFSKTIETQNGTRGSTLAPGASAGVREERYSTTKHATRNTELAAHNAPHFSLALLIGFLIGLLSGVVGIGGGIFLSPVIIFARWGTPKQAAAVSAAFIVLNSFSGLIGRLAGGTFQLDTFSLALIPFGLLGALIGSWFGARQLSSLNLRRALGVVMSFAVTNFWWTLFK
ncbi:MAG: sulfite exporter TauE/SafE family protein [Chloroflexi bacterium]|nr:sulfite exporter TauE/SafE family protein [Chloroflexota bacterium]